MGLHGRFPFYVIAILSFPRCLLSFLNSLYVAFLFCVFSPAALFFLSLSLFLTEDCISLNMLVFCFPCLFLPTSWLSALRSLSYVLGRCTLSRGKFKSYQQLQIYHNHHNLHHFHHIHHHHHHHHELNTLINTSTTGIVSVVIRELRNTYSVAAP
jgi:hypothetical protein